MFVQWDVNTLLTPFLTLVVFAALWPAAAQERSLRRGGTGWIQATALSAEEDAKKLQVLMIFSDEGDGLHPHQLNESAKGLREQAEELARTQTPTAAAEAMLLREAAEQLERMRGQALTLIVPESALVTTVKELSLSDLEQESRVQMNVQFEESLPQGEIPASVQLARFGNLPMLVWTAPRQSPLGLQRWGQSNRGTLTGVVVSYSPLLLDVGRGTPVTLVVPHGADVRYIAMKNTRLDAIASGSRLLIQLASREEGEQRVERVFVGEVDLGQLRAASGLFWSGRRGR